MNSGGKISAGLDTAAGTLNTGNMTVNGGVTYLFNVSAETGTAGIDWDLMNIAGVCTIAATPANAFTIDIIGTPTFDNSIAHQWELLRTTGGIVNFDSSAITILTSNFGSDTGGGTFSLSSDGTSIFMNFAPIPEPSTIALGILGGVALIGSRLRRAKK